VCAGDVLQGRGGAGSGDEGCRAWAALLGAYKAERTLGEGSFGKVKHARRDRGAPPWQGPPRRRRLRARLGARAPRRGYAARRAPTAQALTGIKSLLKDTHGVLRKWDREFRTTSTPAASPWSLATDNFVTYCLFDTYCFILAK
jgi:hypothetical protein